MAPPIVKRYLIALDRHKWAGLAGFAVVMGLSGVAALQPPPPTSYTSQGLLTYVSPPLVFSQTGVALQQQGQSLTPEMLLSDYVIDSAIKGLEAQQIKVDRKTIRQNTVVEINPGQGGGDGEGDQPAGFHVSITYVDVDQERSEKTANLLMAAMVEQSRLFNTKQLGLINENLNELLPKVSNELRDAEQDLERYIRVEGPALQAAEDGSLVGAITGGQNQQRQIRLTLAGVDAQISSLQSRLGMSADQAYAASALSADPIIANLRGQLHQNETQRAILAQTLRPEHPTIVDLDNQHRAYEQMLQQRVNEVIGGQGAPLATTTAIRQGSSLDPARQQLANTLVNLKTQRDTLQQQLFNLSQTERQLRQQYANLPNKQLEQARLEQQVTLKRNFYDQIQAKLTDVTIAENEAVGNLVVTQPASAQIVAETGNNPLLILIVGGFVGLLVGGGLVLLLDSLDATFHTLPDLQGALRQQEVPVLGLLPLISQQQDVDGIPLVVDVDSPYMESYERFRSTLRRLAGANKTIKMVLLTSTVNGEGKTLTAYNLAIASARAGRRTLLIEADLRSPSQARILKVTTDPDSAVEPLRYYGHLSDCIRLVPEIENLYVLPSPGVQRQAAAILESTEMRQVLEDVRGRFDLVILDTPALSRFSDALLLEPYTDGMVIVTRPGYTEEGLLAEAVEQFTESDDIQFLGAVINGADIDIQPFGSYDTSDNQFMVEDLENQSELNRVRLGQ
ncbi:MAG TPA: polysaccharide biosynthesis tyrosine autokinase [Crinalium sp.]|jgi:capsular exopolysaccharide synthesis family protein